MTNQLIRKRIISVWKPIIGPVRDWPLAICHPRSVNLDNLEPCDLVYPDYVVENQQVYHSPELEWLYLGGQKASEVLIFLQADTETKRLRPVVHSSFPVLEKESARTSVNRRESIEARALVYY